MILPVKRAESCVELAAIGCCIETLDKPLKWVQIGSQSEGDMYVCGLNTNMPGYMGIQNEKKDENNTFDKGKGEAEFKSLSVWANKIGRNKYAEGFLETAVLQAKQDKYVKYAIEKIVDRNTECNVNNNLKSSLGGFRDFEVAVLLQREKDKTLSKPIFEVLKGTDPVRLDEVNRKFELGLDFDINEYCNLKDLVRPEKNINQSLRNFFLGVGDVNLNAAFYGSLLDTSRLATGPASQWAVKVLNEFESRLGGCDDQDFEKLFAAVNRYQEISNQPINNNNLEKNGVILNIVGLDKVHEEVNPEESKISTTVSNGSIDSTDWERKGISDIMNGEETREAQDLYNQLIFIGDNPEHERAIWAGNILSTLKNINPEFMAQLRDDNQKIFYESKVNSFDGNIGTEQSDKSDVAELNLSEFVAKLVSGEIELSSHSEALQELVNISMDKENPRYTEINAALEEITKGDIDRFIFIDKLKNVYFSNYIAMRRN